MADFEYLEFELNHTLGTEYGYYGPTNGPKPVPVPVIRKALAMRGKSPAQIESTLDRLRAEQDEEDEAVEELLDDFPARQAFISEGYTSVDDVLEAVESETLTDISGVGEATAEQVFDYLADEGYL